MERRFSSRTKDEIKCIVIHNEDNHKCTIIDMSRDGLALLSDTLKPELNDIIVILFEDNYNNEFYGILSLESSLSACVKNITNKHGQTRIGVSISNAKYAEYIDIKQAHLWALNALGKDGEKE